MLVLYNAVRGVSENIESLALIVPHYLTGLGFFNTQHTVYLEYLDNCIKEKQTNV